MAYFAAIGPPQNAADVATFSWWFLAVIVGWRTAMPWMGILKSGSACTIKFEADGANTGTSIVASTWLGAGNLPDGPIISVAPGTNDSASPQVPSCDLLQINVHIPPAGHGTLTVSQNAKTVATKPITDDVVWIFSVVAP